MNTVREIICNIAVVLFFSVVTINASPAYADDKTIVIIGDSISSAYGINYLKGWVNQLQTKLTQVKPGYLVINASITGDVSAAGKQRIGGLLQRHSPAVVVIELGGNDGLRGLPLADLKSNLQSMIVQSIESGAKVLLTGIQITPNYGPKYSAAFAQIYTELARLNHINLVPFLLTGIGGVAAMMQNDGIHPNQQAQLIILENVWSRLESILD